MTIRLMLLATTFFIVCSAGSAQQKAVPPAGYIDFATVRLKLGMTKERTITQLAERYDVSTWKGFDIDDSWAVVEKSENHLVVGYLSFVNGVLVKVGKFWETEDSAYSLAHTVSLLLGHLRDEGYTHCSISTRSEPTPSIDVEVLAINCGQKGIVVQTQRNRNGKDAEMVQVTENLEAH